MDLFIQILLFIISAINLIYGASIQKRDLSYYDSMGGTHCPLLECPFTPCPSGSPRVPRFFVLDGECCVSCPSCPEDIKTPDECTLEYIYEEEEMYDDDYEHSNDSTEEVYVSPDRTERNESQSEKGSSAKEMLMATNMVSSMASPVEQGSEMNKPLSAWIGESFVAALGWKKKHESNQRENNSKEDIRSLRMNDFVPNVEDHQASIDETSSTVRDEETKLTTPIPTTGSQIRKSSGGSSSRNTDENPGSDPDDPDSNPDDPDTDPDDPDTNPDDQDTNQDDQVTTPGDPTSILSHDLDTTGDSIVRCPSQFPCPTLPCLLWDQEMTWLTIKERRCPGCPICREEDPER